MATGSPGPVPAAAPGSAAPAPAQPAIARVALSPVEDLTDSLVGQILGGNVEIEEIDRAISASKVPASPPGVVDATKQQFAVQVGPAPAAAATPASGGTPVMVQVDEISTDEVQAIKDLVENNPNSLSTQALLGDVLTEIVKINSDYKIEIKAAFAGSPTPEVKAFTVPSAPGDTYYQLEVTYKITVKTKDGKEVKVDIPDLKREIYTTATTQETAIVAANDMKETVINLAMATVDPKYKARFENFDKTKDEAMKQRIFRINYSYDREGNPTALKSIQVGDSDKKSTDLMFKGDPKAGEYIYYRDLKTQEMHRIKTAKLTEYAGKAIYGTEQEALLNTPFVVKDDKPYERLEKSDNYDRQISDIKERIKKREDEIAELKSHFIHKPAFYQVFSSPADAPAFKQLLANLRFEKGEAVPEEELSPAKQQEIQFKGLLKQMGSKKDIEQDLKKLDAQLVQMKGGQDSAGNDVVGDPLAPIADDVEDLMEEISSLDPDFFQQTPAPTDMQRLEKCIELKEAQLNEVEELEQGIAQAKKAVNKKKSDLNNDFARLQKLLQALDSDVELLAKIKQGASDRSQDPATAGAALERAKAVLALISEKETTALEASAEASRQFIDELAQKLELV